MSVKIKQGDTIAILSNLDYSPADGVIEGTQAYVIEESLGAETDKVLVDGPAEIIFKAQIFPVVVTVLEFEDDEDEQDIEDTEEEARPVCEILIDVEGDDGLPKLAEALELI